MLFTILCFGYGFLALNALLNKALMVRPAPIKGGKDGKAKEGKAKDVAVLIPARNEAENLRELIPALLKGNKGLKVYVFDDESEDDTAGVAKRLGAQVVRSPEPLPPGWTGKNWACDHLAKAAMEDSPGAWLLFLDADTRPQPGFLTRLMAYAASCPSKVGVISGMPKLVHGQFPEAMFLAWVPWILLSTNPFWLVARTGLGHNRFTNGQVVLWRSSVYSSLWPNDRLRSAVLEDARIGRLLAKEKIGLRVLDLSELLETHMYKTWQECYDGLSKNAYEVMGSQAGTIFLAAVLILIAWGWTFGVPLVWLPYGLFLVSGVYSAWCTETPLWIGLIAPITVTLGAFTLIRSARMRRQGQVIWKGRNYAGIEKAAEGTIESPKDLRS